MSRRDQNTSSGTHVSEQIVQQYFHAWNAHDGAAVVATFAADGTYADPTTPGPLSGDAIGANAAGLWSWLPDVSFEIRSHARAGDDLFAAEWTMRGTNLGSFNGLPPTGKTIEVEGADFIRVANGRIRSDRRLGAAPSQCHLGALPVVRQDDQPRPRGRPVPVRHGARARIAVLVGRRAGRGFTSALRET
jgi:steroid delta-isomerase-like uncharacterized protein